MVNESVSIAKTAELLNKLSETNLKTVSDLVAMLAGEPAKAATPAEENAQDVERKMLLAQFRNLSPEDRTDVLEEMREESPADTQETTKTAVLQPVELLARTTLARLIVGEYGHRIFGNTPLDEQMDLVEGLYIEVRGGVMDGFPGIEESVIHETIIACEDRNRYSADSE